MKRLQLSPGPKRWRVAALAASVGALLAAGIATAAPSDSSTASSFHATTPVRVLDTRDGIGAPANAVAAGATLDVVVASLPDDVTAIAINLTVVNATRAGFMTAFAKGDTRPWTSSVNWSSSAPVANSITTSVHTAHAVSLYNSAGTVDVVMDLIGYYAPSPAGASGTKGDSGAPGARGETGVRGAEGIGVAGPSGVGADGPMGPAGADGLALGVVNYLYAVHTGAQTVALLAAVPFDPVLNFVVAGDLTFDGSSSSTFRISTEGTYKVSFGITTNGESQFDLVVNGVVLRTFGAPPGQNQGIAIVKLTAEAVVSLENRTSVGGVVLGVNTGGTSGAVTNAWIAIEQMNVPAL